MFVGGNTVVSRDYDNEAYGKHYSQNNHSDFN